MRKFKNIYVEITKACNLACKFCPSSISNNKNNKYLSFEEFKYIIDEIKEHTEGIYLHILGEPLLHKELFNFINYASKFLKVSLTTNGYLINKHIDDLINSNLYVLNISLQSINNLEDLDSYFVNLNKLIVSRSNKLPIHLRIWNNKQNSFVDSLNTKLYELIDNYHLLDYPYVTLSVADEFDWPTLDMKENPIKTTCLGAKSQMGILLNGDVTICCLDYLGNAIVGNIYKNHFIDLINSDIFKNVLKGWNDLNPYFDLCNRCTYRNRFRKDK